MKLLLFIDGLNEAENLAHEQYGDDHLLDMLHTTHCTTAQQLVDRLKDSVEAHRNGAEPNEDLTMMCLRVN